MQRPDGCVEVAIAVVWARDGGQLLICRRKAGAVLGGCWEFPGGKCHAGELLAACAVREVEEETSLRVTVLAALPAIEHEYPHARVRLHPFVCRHESGALELRGAAEAVWIDPSAVEDYQFPEANRELLRQVRRGLKAMLAGRA